MGGWPGVWRARMMQQHRMTWLSASGSHMARHTQLHSVGASLSTQHLHMSMAVVEASVGVGLGVGMAGSAGTQGITHTNPSYPNPLRATTP